MTPDEEAFVRRFRRIRYTVCATCEGSGGRWYASTAKWRDGIGGCAITHGECDVCWGSGDSDHPWMDLRKLEAEQADKIERLASIHFERHLGASYQHCRTALLAIATILDKLSNKRKPPVGKDYFEVRAWQDTTRRLAELLRTILEKAPK